VQGIYEDQDRENRGKAWIYNMNKKGAMTTCVTLHHGVKRVLTDVAKAVESGGVVQESYVVTSRPKCKGESGKRVAFWAERCMCLVEEI
jgi:hypothetical protein